VQAFIIPSVTTAAGDNVRTDGSVLDQLKVILKLRTNDVSLMGDLSAGNVGLQVYNKTLGTVLVNQTINVDASLAMFQASAQAGHTGMTCAYQSVQIYGISNFTQNFDCVWLLRLSSPDARVLVSTNGFQKLFFIPE